MYHVVPRGSSASKFDRVDITLIFSFDRLAETIN